MGRPMSEMILLRDVADLTNSPGIECGRYSRKGRVSMARMFKEHGLDAPVWHVWRDLGADCPYR